MADTTGTPLDRAAQLYDEYVEIAEISSLAQLVHVNDDDDMDPQWYGAPPAGLVLSA